MTDKQLTLGHLIDALRAMHPDRRAIFGLTNPHVYIESGGAVALAFAPRLGQSALELLRLARSCNGATFDDRPARAEYMMGEPARLWVAEGREGGSPITRELFGLMFETRTRGLLEPWSDLEMRSR